MSGRRKKSEITKEVEGAKSRPRDTVMMTAEAPPMPAYFKKSKTLPKVWNEVVTDLDRLNILSRTDAGTVEAYVILLDRMRRLQERIDQEGESTATQTRTGMRRFKNPDVDTLSKTIQQLRQYAIEMGCTPASRSKVPNLVQPGLFDMPKGDQENRWSPFSQKH